MTIVSELSRLVSLYQLLEVSETEQNLVCQSNHNEIVQVWNSITFRKNSFSNKIENQTFDKRK